MSVLDVPCRAWTSRSDPSSSIAELTELLHRAYGALAQEGFRFWASHQTEEHTRQRIAEGHCSVALLEGKLVGTITLKKKERTKGSPWYDRPDVASFGQFGRGAQEVGVGTFDERPSGKGSRRGAGGSGSGCARTDSTRAAATT